MFWKVEYQLFGGNSEPDKNTTKYRESLWATPERSNDYAAITNLREKCLRERNGSGVFLGPQLALRSLKTIEKNTDVNLKNLKVGDGQPIQKQSLVKNFADSLFQSQALEISLMARCHLQTQSVRKFKIWLVPFHPIFRPGGDPPIPKNVLLTST